jgi:DNA-3-methyladenine glycosylase II
MSAADPVEHLRVADPILRQVIDEVGVDGLGDPRAGRPDDSYGALVRSIVGQQLSTRAAPAIYARLEDRFGGRPPMPHEVLADDPDQLRTAAGLSHAKVAYLRSLAEHVLDGSLDLDQLDRLSDDEAMAALVAVRGIGRWSAQLFLMFHLGRPDVVAAGDLGIRRAVMIRYELPELPAPAAVEKIAEAWRPYRTLGCRFLWRLLHATPGRGRADLIGSPRSPSPAKHRADHALTARPQRRSAASKPPRTARPASDGRNLLLFRHAERGATATGGDHVRVVNLEAGALESVDEVDRRALHVGDARPVDQEADALVLEHGVPGTLLVEGERILEAGAPATADSDAQPRGLGDRLLGCEELADLLGALVGQSDHPSFSIAMPPRYA